MYKTVSGVTMLSNIIKVKLEENSCSVKELEEFFAQMQFGTKWFKDSSIKLLCQRYYKCGDKWKISFTLTLPREAVPNSFALKLLSLLSKGNELALPVILKYLSYRTVFKDFGQKLQDKMDQDIKEQNDSKISQEIELCKKDILNVLNGGRSVLDNQLRQRYIAYYSLMDSEVKELKIKISKELEDYTSNINVNKMYQSLNNKIKKIGLCEIRGIAALCTCGFTAFFMLLLAPLIALFVCAAKQGSIGYLHALMYTASPFLVVAALALTVAGVAYLTSYCLKHSFTKEIQDYIEQPIKCMDKATSNKELDNFPSDNYEKVQPSAPLEELLPSYEESCSSPPSYEESCHSSLGNIQPSNPIQQNKLLR